MRSIWNGLAGEVFQEKDGALCFDLVGRAERCNEDREASAIERAFGFSVDNGGYAVVQGNIPCAGLAQSRLPRREIDSAGVRPVFGRHRPVKDGKSGRVEEVRQQGRDVAVADEDLRVGLDLRKIEFFQQIVRPVTSTGTDDGADILAREHFFQFASAAGGRSGEVEIAIEDRV